MAAARYVEQNPVRAGIVSRPWDYPWSSARGHLGEIDDPILSKTWPHESLLLQWRDLISTEEDACRITDIRMATRTGRPLGASGFVEDLERILGRPLKRKPAGRPSKRRKKRTRN
jgi:putative transposase